MQYLISMNIVTVAFHPSHLPLYLVAAFAKRIARLSLTAPPNGSYYIILCVCSLSNLHHTGVMVAAVFIVNLLKRHPNCRVLVHRKNADEFSYATGEDPYDMDQEDPANCNALDSCLWELKVCAMYTNRY